MSKTMRPLEALPLEARRDIGFVLCDIDDTLTTDGRLPAVSYRALERLQQAGLKVLPITGRPAGWCDHMARMWPIDGIVGENGAFYFRYDRGDRRMTRTYWTEDARRTADRRRLQALEARILSEVPGAAVASDQPYREADLAIDYCEDVAPLSADEVERILALFEEAGAQAKVSSDRFALSPEAMRAQAIFVGDSPNDAPMFAFFPNSVGVANVRAFAGRLAAEPAYVTHAAGGQGFAELAEALLSAL